MEISENKYNRPLGPNEGQVPFEVKYGGRMVFLAYASGLYAIMLVVVVIVSGNTTAFLTAFTIATMAVAMALVGGQKMTEGHKPQFDGRRQTEVIMEQLSPTERMGDVSQESSI